MVHIQIITHFYCHIKRSLGFCLTCKQNTGSFEDMSELKTINHSYSRPVIARIPDNDHLMKVHSVFKLWCNSSRIK